MAETSRSQVTITLGRTGQVVKKPGPVLDSAFSHSQEGLGSKRSVRDRLGGSNGDSSQLSNKRLRVDNTRLSTSAANSVDDMRLGRDDLRFKIMQKNKQTQSNGQHNGVDLREMLSRPARPSTKSLAMQQHILDPRSSRHQMPELKDVRHRLPETKDVRLRVPEPDGVRQRMPEATSASILGRVPHMRTADALPQLVDLRSSYSTWTLEHLRQRSADGVLSGISPPRNGEEMQRRPLMRSYDDVRTVPYMGKDDLKVSRPMGTASFMAKPTLSAAPTKAVAHLQTPPLSGVIQKSSYAVDEQHTVEGFLNSLGLEKYYISFRAEEVDMTALRQMGDNDLKELGIPMGPRKKILLALMSRSRRQV